MIERTRTITIAGGQGAGDRQAGEGGGPPLVDPYTGGDYLRSDNSHRTVVDVNDEIDMLMMSRYPLAVPAVEL